MEEKQAKARKQAQLIQRMKKMNITPQGVTGADAVLAEISAKEEERKRAEEERKSDKKLRHFWNLDISKMSRSGFCRFF